MITKRAFFIALTVALNLLAFPIPGGFRLFVLFATAFLLLSIAIGSFVLWLCHPTAKQGWRDLDYVAVAVLLWLGLTWLWFVLWWEW